MRSNSPNQVITLDEARALGVECRCVVNHVPLPRQLHKHHIVPLYLGGTDTRANIEVVCPTTHYNVHEVIDYWEKGQKPPFRVNSYTLDLARRGWDGRETSGS